MEPDDPMLLACRRFTRASDLLDERIASRLGIGRNDLRALNVLEEGPRSQVDVARDLRMTRAAVTALVDRLERQGLIRRFPHPTDRRVTQVELSADTWMTLARVYRPIGAAVGAVVEHLTQPERERFARLIDHISSAFDEQQA